MKAVLFAAPLLAVAQAALLPRQAVVTPKVKSTTVLGNATDPKIERDSCGSSSFGKRTLWTCRDTQPSTGGLPIWSNSASWSNLTAEGLPALTPSGNLVQYGGFQKPFFPYQADECGSNTAGACSDGTRYALWPDSPPMTTHTGADGSVVAYSWVKKSHINDSNLASLDQYPPTSLYRINYSPSVEGFNSTLPEVTLVAENFYADGQMPYGDYGNVVHNGMCYLYGQADGTIALAKVPVGSVEDLSTYKYLVNGAWTSTRPTLGSAGTGISLGAGGQGTFYYSSVWQCWVWIGGNKYPGADFYISTAPHPKGPWTDAVNFYTGKDGSKGLGAYSLQAHPALGNPGGNGIYISYTKLDSLYSTPLIEVLWE